MDVMSLDINIPQNEGIKIIRKAYENFYKDNLFLHIYLPEIPKLILKENSFHFNGNHHLQTHGAAMGTKTAVFFANIFMAYIEQQLQAKPSLNQQFGNAI